MPLFSVFLHMICLLLACHSYSQYSLIFFGKVLCALVSKVIILSLYLCCFCLLCSSPSSGIPYSFYIQPVICANIPLSLKLPSHCAFFHTLSCSFSPPLWAELCPLVPGISLAVLELIGGDILRLLCYREMLPSTRQSQLHFDLSQQGKRGFFPMPLVCCCHMEKADGVDQEVNLEAYPFLAACVRFVH